MTRTRLLVFLSVILSFLINLRKRIETQVSMSGIQYKMGQRLIHKFLRVGATSEANAVTYIEAELDMSEQCWLDYFAGSFLGCIKKTKEHKYYISKGVDLAV